ncbi:MAG: hypothetical protein FJW39_05330 [Acidobacteria bacterium]|nr:hypothetical protein [Acidobacteriota bacterium]
MRLIRITGIALAGLLAAQDQPLLDANKALAHYAGMIEWMNTAAGAIPGLARAGSPQLENSRQALDTLRRTGNPNHTPTHYAFLASARGFLAIADSLPKPHPFHEDSRRAVSSLRDAVDRAETHLRALLDVRERATANPDRDNLKRYEEANTLVGMAQPGNPRVVFLGDSITDGWRLNEYFPGKDLINRGIGGQITGQMLGRMMADVIRAKPAAMVVLAGTNDISRGIPATAVQDNLAMIAELATANKIKVILASILPVHDYNKDKDPSLERSTRRPPETIRQINTWIKAYCQQKGFVYLDYHTPMADSAGFLRQELAEDGLHPNADGYKVMAPLASAAIQKVTFVPVLEPPAKKKRLLPFGGK